ncbi:metallophosphoesterase [Variovorax sp. NFACC27]|uniref:metallophosphoesterase n=1 Tax=unclassified Variovorax TaxID=663243 RepID=UPI00089818F8|nr:Predicted phosphoesterase [Variovorax sp. NFACC28]SEG10165.1 Predicted phosphoesterase [Variovorax sp. NFACC29]SFC04431.1 Predicted phosphoesterase [Variovorax sp. NFACC26]SFH08164.1 Predicted phosphoesterase [Variovorax sp. NFACC27]
MNPLIPSNLPAHSGHEQSAPKLMFFGDPHGDLEPVIAAVERFRPEAIVLLGDIQARRPLHIELGPILDLTEVWFIHGNHDTDSDADYDNLWGSELADRNLHGRIVEIAGFKVAGLGGIFRSKIWDPRQPLKEAAFASADALRRSMRPEERWRDGIARRHRSTIFPDDYQPLLRSPSADILVTHEAPAAHPHGWQAIDGLAEALGVQLVVHGHHHQNIDYRAEGMLTKTAPFRAFGVDMGSHLAWPRSFQNEAGLGSPPPDLLDLATQVFGAAAQAWLDKPHEWLDGQTPAAFAAAGGADKVRSMLNAIQHGGVV